MYKESILFTTETQRAQRKTNWQNEKWLLTISLQAEHEEFMITQELHNLLLLQQTLMKHEVLT